MDRDNLKYKQHKIHSNMGIKKEKIVGKLIINEYDSSNLKGSEYNTTTSELIIEFKKGEKVKNVLLDALRKRYEAQIAEADATIKIYFENSVGIGEHPQHVDEVDKLIEKIANAEEKLEVIKEFE